MSAMRALALAIDLARRQRDEAACAVVQAERVWQMAQNQMDQLQAYAADTDERWSASGRASVTPELMRHHYQFMARLQHAMGLQTDVIAAHLEQVALARKGLLEAEFRLFGLSHLVDKKQARMALELARLEQKQMDEMAAQQFARARLGQNYGEHA